MCQMPAEINSERTSHTLRLQCVRALGILYNILYNIE